MNSDPQFIVLHVCDMQPPEANVICDWGLHQTDLSVDSSSNAGPDNHMQLFIINPHFTADINWNLGLGIPTPHI